MKTFIYLLLGTLLFSCDPQTDIPTAINGDDDEPMIYPNHIEYYLDGSLYNSRVAITYLTDGKLSIASIDTNAEGTMIGFGLLVDTVLALPGITLFADTLGDPETTDFVSVTLNSTDVYYSHSCENRDNNNAYIEILSINYIDGHISGTFSGRVSHLDGSNPMEITDGLFTELTLLP